MFISEGDVYLRLGLGFLLLFFLVLLPTGYFASRWSKRKRLHEENSAKDRPVPLPLPNLDATSRRILVNKWRWFFMAGPPSLFILLMVLFIGAQYLMGTGPGNSAGLIMLNMFLPVPLLALAATYAHWRAPARIGFSNAGIYFEYTSPGLNRSARRFTKWSEITTIKQTSYGTKYRSSYWEIHLKNGERLNIDPLPGSIRKQIIEAYESFFFPDRVQPAYMRNKKQRNSKLDNNKT
jgi:hypothetical protein